MWPMSLMMSRLPGGHSGSVKKLGCQQSTGTTRRLVPTKRSGRRLRRWRTGDTCEWAEILFQSRYSSHTGHCYVISFAVARCCG